MNREQEKVVRLLRNCLEDAPTEFEDGPGDEYASWRKKVARIYEYIGGQMKKEFNYASGVIRIGSIYGGGLSAPASAYKNATVRTKKVMLETIDLAESGILPISNALPAMDQRIDQRISLSQKQEQSVFLALSNNYDEETRVKISELYTELRKKKQNKSKVKQIIGWLAEHAADFLVEVLAGVVLRND